MRLSRLEIENFKSIGAKQIIDIKPITLLFGPNSVGKSTIIQAIYYLYQVLDGNSDLSDKSKLGNIDLGGFPSIVHKQDISKNVRIKATLDWRTGDTSDYFPLNDRSDYLYKEIGIEPIPINYLLGNKLTQGNIIEMSVGIEIKYLSGETVVNRLEIDINRERLITTCLPKEPDRFHFLLPESISLEINYKHHMLKRLDKLFLMEVESSRPSDPSNVVSVDIKNKKWNNPSKELQDWENDVIKIFNDYFKENNTSYPLIQEIYEVLGIEEEGDFIKIPSRKLGIKLNKKDWLPEMSQVFDNFRRYRLKDDHRDFKDLDLSTPFNISKKSSIHEKRFEQLRAVIKELLINPITAMHGYLENTMYVGPMRDIPKRNYISKNKLNENPWTGLNVWETFCSHSQHNRQYNLDNVNYWLLKGFNTGYNIEIQRFIDISQNDISQFIKIDSEENQNLKGLEHYPRIFGFKLRDIKRNILVDTVDVGYGISQLIPVILAAIDEDVCAVAIEQPELHLHPAHQVVLGDLFIKGMEIKSCFSSIILETHSEHLILRLLRRIRETTNNELPNDTLKLKPDQIAVIYVHSIESGIELKNMPVNSEGEFTNKWPSGFFEERAEELF
ncbi:MAG: AAA family ATPase [Gammaproteobacteria bacterium]|nr:AAA family ATPase [Gammaproteobacteria bacterium]